MRNRFECQILSIKEDPFLTTTYAKGYGEDVKGYTLQAKVLKFNEQGIVPRMFELQVYGTINNQELLLVDPLYKVQGVQLCTKPIVKLGDYMLIKGYGFSPKKHKRIDNVINKSHYLTEQGERIEFWITRRPLIVDTWEEGNKLESGKGINQNHLDLINKAITNTEEEKVEVIA